MTEQTNEALMAQFALGDFDAFETLYARNKGGLYRYLLRQLHEPSIAEDIFQEVWGKVIANANEYQAKAKFTTWLYTLARNRVIDYTRHLKVVSRHVDVHADASELDSGDSQHIANLDIGYNQAEKRVEQNEQAKAIKRCLKKLPAHQLECFLLKEEGGLSHQSIAEIVNTSLEASKSRLRIAYQNLRQCLSKELNLALDSPEHAIGASKTKGGNV